jgi:SagB-type dehydrogenase family enzyme
MTARIEEVVQLRPDVAGVVAPDGSYHLISWPYSDCLGRLSSRQSDLLRRLAAEPISTNELACEDFAAHLDLLRTRGWLQVTVMAYGRKIHTVEPEGPTEDRAGEMPGDLALSRFAIARRDGSDLLLESPLSRCRVRLHESQALAWLGRAVAGDHPAMRRFRHDLWAVGLADDPDDEAEDRLSTCQWQPHELWFHHRSRTHWPGTPHGTSNWAVGRFDPLAARRGPFGGEVVDLSRGAPVLDLQLTAALEERRSVRRHDDVNPITAADLGELLYRCARNRDIYSIDGVERVSRPYPAGGALHELEIYPVIRKVSGLEPGLYHYDPQHHRLERISETTLPVRRLLRAGASAAGAEEPQVLLVIAARFGRVMWNYQSMAYALIMKHVGVLFQTMYLVATSMGLAPCALGGGDAAAFAEATGLDPLEEGSVGEFALGSRHPEAGS